MEATRVISTTTMKAPSHNNNTKTTHKIHLNPWDLNFLTLETIQKGLLFHNPHNIEEQQDISIQIQHLKNTLSSTLSFFPLLSGRLDIILNEHEDNKNATSYILCNNSGVLFVHAVAENTSVSDILPLLAVQVTELIDSIFIGCTLNHVVADGKSFWHFINSWAEISRGNHKISKLPSFQRFFFDTIDQPIRFTFTKHDESYSKNSSPLPERVFHFSKEEILKLKANEEANTDKISSLQALLSHVWKSVTRCKHVDP
ncbi:putative transferase [Lupinus albus]|uniref:Putative transferase n=1 Tax=Lupinus albus TaxID=3870 RepID=A0A6A4QLH7_LUPAL|nr:putative transferase [Lupinus albus]